MQINIPTIVWAMLNFLVLALVLKKFFFGPITNMLDERAERVKKDMDSAEADRLAMEKMKEEYTSQIQNAHLEAQQIITAAKRSAEETKNEILEEAREGASKLKDKAIKEIEEEKVSAIRELKGEVSGLSLLLAEKIIGRSLNPDDHKKLINDFMEEAGDLN